MAEVVDSEHRAASAETSITLKRLSKVRDSTVTIQNVLPTFRSIYESSSLRDKISMTTFRRMRKEEFRKLARRTDVCNYCLAGQSIRKKLGKLLKSAKGKSGYSMSVWNVSRSSGLILQCMLNSPGSVPQNIKLQAAEYIQQLVEIDLHTEEFRRQNAIYAEKTQDPGDSLVITLDYKEKGTLPQVPQEGNSHFYKQGKYSCLGEKGHRYPKGKESSVSVRGAVGLTTTCATALDQNLKAAPVASLPVVTVCVPVSVPTIILYLFIFSFLFWSFFFLFFLFHTTFFYLYFIFFFFFSCLIISSSYFFLFFLFFFFFFFFSLPLS